jgi:hypothetical protein
LAKKLQEMQARVVRGQTHEKLDQKNREQQEMIKKQNEELEKRKAEEALMKQQLQEREENRMELEQQYVSIQEEVDIKTKKLNKLWKLYQNSKNEIKDLQDEMIQEREDLMFGLRESERDRKLYKKIVEMFVPPEELNKILNRAFWSEDNEDWSVMHAVHSGNNVRMSRPSSAMGDDKKPMTEWAKMASVNSTNPRFKTDNLVQLELDLPQRTTQDYEVMSSGYGEEAYVTHHEEEVAGQYYQNSYAEEEVQPKRPQSSKRPKTASSRKTERQSSQRFV